MDFKYRIIFNVKEICFESLQHIRKGVIIHKIIKIRIYLILNAINFHILLKRNEESKFVFSYYTLIYFKVFWKIFLVEKIFFHFCFTTPVRIIINPLERFSFDFFLRRYLSISENLSLSISRNLSSRKCNRDFYFICIYT